MLGRDVQTINVWTIESRAVTRVEQFPGHGGRRKVVTTSQILSSIQHISFRKTSGTNMGETNLILASGAI